MQVQYMGFRLDPSVKRKAERLGILSLQLASNIRNIVISSGFKNEQNVIKMALKKLLSWNITKFSNRWGSIYETLELHEVTQQAAKLRQFSNEKILAWFKRKIL